MARRREGKYFPLMMMVRMMGRMMVRMMVRMMGWMVVRMMRGVIMVMVVITRCRGG